MLLCWRAARCSCCATCLLPPSRPSSCSSPACCSRCLPLAPLLAAPAGSCRCRHGLADCCHAALVVSAGLLPLVGLDVAAGEAGHLQLPAGGQSGGSQLGTQVHRALRGWATRQVASDANQLSHVPQPGACPFPSCRQRQRHRNASCPCPTSPPAHHVRSRYRSRSAGSTSSLFRRLAMATAKEAAAGRAGSKHISGPGPATAASSKAPLQVYTLKLVGPWVRGVRGKR